MSKEVYESMESMSNIVKNRNKREDHNRSSHITPVGGNIFEDLGFPAEEAKRLKEESDRKIQEKKNKK